MGRKKILVVDNNKAFRKLITTFLLKEGHEVQEADSGFSALRVVAVFIPDIIYVSLVMPKIDGASLCKIFRNIPELEHCFLVIVSAIAVEEQLNLDEIGANACIAKGPFNTMSSHIADTVKESYEGAASKVSSIKGAEALFPRQITQELLDQNYHLENILTSVSQGVLELKNDRVVYLNPAALNLLGIPVQKIYSCRLDELLAPEVWHEIKFSIAHCSKNEKRPLSQVLVTINQQRVIVQALASKGDRGNHIILLTDITKRWEAEEKARESASRIKTFFSSINDAIFVHPFLKKGFAPFIEVNEIACRKYGYSREEFLNLTAMDITVKSDSMVHGNVGYRNQLLQKGNWVFEATHIKKSGERFPVEVNSNIVDQQGRKVVLAVVRDITKRKKTLEEKDALEAKLQQTQKMEAIGRLAGGVAHDFNNMLSVILGFAEMSLEELSPDDLIHQNLVKIRTAAEHSADLTRQLLAFARKQTITPKVLVLNQTISHMLTMLRRLIGEYIVLDYFPDENLWPVLIDPTQVNQIVVNLIINSRDALADGGRIVITTQNTVLDNEYCAEHPGFLPGDYVVVRVSDNGHGVDQDILQMIFEPFFTTKPVGEGTGLGLSTVYGILKQNNGFVQVESEPNIHTTFTIFIPRYMGEATQRRIEEQGWRETVNETILIVEDELTILDMLKIMIRKLGYQVLIASSPGEALRLAAENTGEIDLVMTDVVMPGMSGLELVKELKLLYPGLKYLFSSGHTVNIIEHHGVIDEEHQFIQKPFSENELALKIREALKDR